MTAAVDELQVLVDARRRESPSLDPKLRAADRRRSLMRTLAACRREAGLTQAEVARRMGSSQSSVARLERGEDDPRLSTVDRFAFAVGQEILWSASGLDVPAAAVASAAALTPTFDYGIYMGGLGALGARVFTVAQGARPGGWIAFEPFNYQSPVAQAVEVREAAIDSSSQRLSVDLTTRAA